MHVKAKKSLGQNFLKDETVLARIVESADITASDCVVEIGPGTGALTELLSQKAAKVIALELDHDLIPDLLRQFPLSSNVSIVEQDIIRADMAEILRTHGVSIDQPYKVVANIPYYITAPIIQYLLQLSYPPESIVLMIQKEVAERITARIGAMSVLGVSVHYYADASLLFTVSKTAFDPIPKVDSAVVKIIPKQRFHKENDKSFFRIVKMGFSARRKTLVNNIASGLHLSKEVVSEKIAQLGLDVNIRAQALSIDDWKRLSQAFLEK